MKINVRVLPILLSLTCSLLFLFGGWFLYQHIYVEQPIKSYIAQKPQVVLNNLQIQKNEIIIDLDFKDPSNFPTDYQEIYQFIADKSNGKAVHIRLPQQGNEMKKLWSEEYFELAEAIQKEEYSRIPDIIDKMKASRGLNQSLAQMDDQNIYIYLQDGSGHLYAVLPRKEGVKVHE